MEVFEETPGKTIFLYKQGVVLFHVCWREGIPRSSNDMQNFCLVAGFMDEEEGIWHSWKILDMTHVLQDLPFQDRPRRVKTVHEARVRSTHPLDRALVFACFSQSEPVTGAKTGAELVTGSG